MATLLIFGNPLKFGSDSYRNAKGRPTFLHREKERAPEAPREAHHHHYWKGPSNRALHMQELLPRWVVERRLATMPVVFTPCFDRGHSSTKPTLWPTTGPNWPLLHNYWPPPPIFVSQLPPHRSQPVSKPRSKLWKVVERGGNKEGRAKKGIGERETPVWERKTLIWATERESKALI